MVSMLNLSGVMLSGRSLFRYASMQVPSLNSKYSFMAVVLFNDYCICLYIIMIYNIAQNEFVAPHYGVKDALWKQLSKRLFAHKMA